MKRKIYLLTATLLASVLTTNVWGQNWVDVTSTYLDNADFSDPSTITEKHVNTYASDNSKNDGINGQQAVAFWTGNDTSDAHAAGAFAIGSEYTVAGSYTVPATNPNGNAEGYVLGLAGCWGSALSYTQDLKVKMPIGKYKFEIKGYNANASATAFGTQTIGVKAGGATYYVSATWTSNTWVTASTEFSLAAETDGQVIIGASNIANGSASSAKVFFTDLKIYYDNSVDKSALEALITTAEGLYDSSKEGASDFSTAINDAKAVKNNASATIAQVLAAETTLQAAIDLYRMKNASETNPVDMTSLLKNPGFEDGTKTSDGNKINFPKEWTVAYDMNGWLDGSINTDAPNEGSKLYNLWAGGVTYTDLYQTVTLPKGIYELAADFRIDKMEYVTDQGVYAKVGDNVIKSTYTITKVASTWNSKEGWNNIAVKFTVSEEMSVQLGASSTGTGSGSAGWYQIDNFTLKYIGYPSDEAAKQAVKDEIESVITQLAAYDGKVGTAVAKAITDAKNAAEALTSASSLSDFNNVLNDLKAAKTLAQNTSEPYLKLKKLIEDATSEKTHSTADSKTDIETAISTAEGCLNSTDVATLESAYTTLETAREAYVDVAVPENGYPFNYDYKVGDIYKSSAWTSQTEAQNKTWKASTEKNTDDYKATGFYENWKGSAYTGKIHTTLTGLRNGTYTVSALAFESGQTGNVSFFAGDQQVALSTETNMFQKPQVTNVEVIDGTLELGLVIASPGVTWLGISTVELAYTSQNVSADMVITDAQYATFCAPFEVTIPSGVTASKVTGVSGTTLTLEAVSTTIPANTPVVLQSENAINETVYGVAVSGTPEAGLLTGVYEDTDAPVGSYVLQYQNDKALFYVVESGSQPTIKANRAYLTVSSGAKELFLEDATGIDKVEFNGQQSTVAFNLAGQAVGNDYKGIVIINGKKYLKK